MASKVKAKAKEVKKLPENALELSNGDTIYFIEELTGRQHLAMQQTVSRAFKSKPVIGKNGQVEGKIDMDHERYQREIVNMFPHVVSKMTDKDGNKIEPSVDYYLDSHFEDARKIFNSVFRILNTRFDSKKN